MLVPFDLILSFLVIIIYSSFFESSISVPLRVLCFPAHGTQGCLAGIDHGEGGEVFVLPENYFVLTLGLSAPLESDRVAAKTEPYPGRWTTHFVISSPSDLDEELFDWIEQAYQFAQAK